MKNNARHYKFGNLIMMEGKPRIVIDKPYRKYEPIQPFVVCSDNPLLVNPFIAVESRRMDKREADFFGAYLHGTFGLEYDKRSKSVRLDFEASDILKGE